MIFTPVNQSHSNSQNPLLKLLYKNHISSFTPRQTFQNQICCIQSEFVSFPSLLKPSIVIGVKGTSIRFFSLPPSIKPSAKSDFQVLYLTQKCTDPSQLRLDLPEQLILYLTQNALTLLRFDILFRSDFSKRVFYNETNGTFGNFKIPGLPAQKKGKPIDTVTPELAQLGKQMLETMHASKGVGLAALQVNHPLQLLVADTRVKDNPEDMRYDPGELSNDLEKHIPQPLILFNPKVIEKSGSVTFSRRLP